MKKLLILTIFAIVALFASSFAQPMLFDVWDDNGLLGTIEAFTGDMTAEDYYNYYSASGHPDENGGPAPAAFTSNIWMYYGTDGLSFNFIHGADNAGGQYWNHVEWDLSFFGTNYGVLFTDDGTPENQGEEGMVDDGFGYILADFAYIRNSDGGIVGIDPVCNPCNWMIAINPFTIGDVTDINFGSADGSYLNGLHLDSPYADIDDRDNHYKSDIYNDTGFYITPHCVPEPGTLILLGMGLLGAGAYRRKK